MYAIVQLHLINNTLLQLLTIKYSKAIAYFCIHNCKWQLLYGLLRLMTIACCRPALTTLDNCCFALLQSTKTFLCTTAIVNYCLHYCNCQSFMEFTIANDNWSVKCFNWLLNAPLYLTTFFIHYCNLLLSFALFQLTTFVLTITT